MSTTEPLPKKVRARSPGYPSLTLSQAIEKTRQLYTAAKRNLLHADVAMQALGYNPTSSSGIRCLAALVAFGLVQDEGSGKARKIRLTDLGYRIVLMPADDPERQTLIRIAAAKPAIYADMLSEWSDSLPVDQAISKFLTLEKHYNPATVGQLIRDFRDTYEFAGLGGNDTLSENGSDISGASAQAVRGVEAAQRQPVGASGVPTMIPNEAPGARVLHIPLPNDRTAVLQAPRGMTEADVDFLIGYVTFMKAAIVGGPIPTRKEGDKDQNGVV